MYKEGERVVHLARPDYGVGVITHTSKTRVLVDWPDVNKKVSYRQTSSVLKYPAQDPHSKPNLEPAMYITAQQKALLIILLELRGTGLEARTDVVARRMYPPVGTATMAAVGLELRSKGLVSSENDGLQYNLWHLTKQGDSAARLAKAHEPKPVPEKWIVWCPQSQRPPVVVHDSQEKAEEVASLMAAKNSPHEFFACKVGAGFKLTRKAKPVEYVETLEKL